MYNFKIGPTDTDSISFCKPDNKPFTKEERDRLLKEINDFLQEGIVMEDDGYYTKVVAVKAKNYVLLEEGKDKPTYKGSSFKSATKEPALKEFMFRIMEEVFINETSTIESIYNEYLFEINNIKDISRWCVKKSITENLLLADSTSKLKVLDAIKNIDYSVGDKVYLFNDIDGMKQSVTKGEAVFLKSGKAKMEENKIYRTLETFSGSYDKKHYVKRLYKTLEIFETLIDMSTITNYSLTKNYSNFVETFQ